MLKQFKKILLTSLLLVCSTYSFAGIEGTYKLDVDALKKAIMAMPEMAQVPAEQLKMLMARFDSAKGTLVLDDDGNISGEMEFMGPKSTGKGTYKLNGSELTITITEEDGIKLPTPEVNTLNYKDGVIFQEQDGMVIQFTKSE